MTYLVVLIICKSIKLKEDENVYQRDINFLIHMM